VFPDLVWDFRLPHVYSINISSHKYGMVYPCLGWLLIRNLPCLEKMTHQNDYLGNNMRRISLQFSHSMAHLLTQYYQMTTLGFQGYKERITQLFVLMDMLKRALIQEDEFYLLDQHEKHDQHLPGVVFGAKNQGDLLQFSANLRNKGWYLPVYRLPAPHHQTEVARIVIRHGFSVEDIQQLVFDTIVCLE
jgi:glutamate decarboxylase